MLYWWQAHYNSYEKQSNAAQSLQFKRMRICRQNGTKYHKTYQNIAMHSPKTAKKREQDLLLRRLSWGKVGASEAANSKQSPTLLPTNRTIITVQSSYHWNSLWFLATRHWPSLQSRKRAPQHTPLKEHLLAYGSWSPKHTSSMQIAGLGTRGSGTCGTGTAVLGQFL